MSRRFRVGLIIVLIHIVVLLLILLAIELIPQRSSYSYRLDVLDCNNLEPLKGCRHEIGHKMDDDLGMPSMTSEFSVAILAHVLVETRPMEVPDDVAILVRLYPDRDPREIYAAIYASVDGRIERLPASLQPFYSTDPSYLTLYRCLAQTGFNFCGGSFSYLKGQ